VLRLFVDFKNAYYSVRREILYNILIEFGNPTNHEGLIKMCRSETYSTVLVGKSLSCVLPVRNGLRKGDALSPLLLDFALW
jgi:hypothetical protein